MKNKRNWTFDEHRHRLPLEDGHFANLHFRKHSGVSYLEVVTPEADAVADIFKDGDGQVFSTLGPETILDYEAELTAANDLPRTPASALRVLIDAVQRGDYQMVERLPEGL